MSDPISKAAAKKPFPLRLTTLLLITQLASINLAFADTTADSHSRWTVLEDNDGMISHHDQHYTQGFRYSGLLPSPVSGGFEAELFSALGHVLPMYRPDPDADPRIRWIVLGQSIFTPSNTDESTPDPTDRPYAGWLYTGVDLLQDNRGQDLNNLELLVGVIGPWSGADRAQDSFHTVFGFPDAHGWSAQLANRGAFQLSFDRKQRISVQWDGRWAADVVGEAGFSVGSVFRYADVGILLRVGDALAVDYGPDRIRPAPSGGGYFKPQALPAGYFHSYAFIGTQTRRVAYNRFIDGATELGGPSLNTNRVVTDLVGGCSLFFGKSVRADFTATRRSREFANQHGDDLFGAAALTVVFD